MDNATSRRRATIRARMETCMCGCRGRDPQHQIHYVRTVSNIRVESRSLLGVPVCFTVGVAKIPSYEEPVRVELVGNEWFTERALHRLNGGAS